MFVWEVIGHTLVQSTSIHNFLWAFVICLYLCCPCSLVLACVFVFSICFLSSSSFLHFFFFAAAENIFFKKEKEEEKEEEEGNTWRKPAHWQRQHSTLRRQMEAERKISRHGG